MGVGGLFYFDMLKSNTNTSNYFILEKKHITYFMYILHYSCTIVRD
jgi:hypothetical protein